MTELGLQIHSKKPPVRAVFLGPRSKGCGLFSEPKRVFEEEIAAALETTPEEMKVKKEHGRIFKDFTLTVETKEAYRRIYGVDYIVN